MRRFSAARGATVFLSAFLPALALAQPPQWRPTRLGSEHGLSHNSVFSILQDRDGFLWIGTGDGLNRYDGYEFVTYRPDPLDETSLVSGIVRSLLEDRAGNLWVGTEDGLDRFDRQNQRFFHYRVGAESPTRGAKLVIWALHEGDGTAILAGTNRGVFRYRPATDRFEAIPIAAVGEVRSFDRHPNGTVWALVADEHSTLRSVVIAPADGSTVQPWHVSFSRPAVSVWAMAIDPTGAFWLLPPAAATPVSSDSGGRRRLLVDSPRHNRAAVAHRGRDGSLWIGTDYELCARPHAREMRCAALVPGGSWLDNYVRALHQDMTGAWWIGTYTGLYRHDAKTKPFRHDRHDPLDPSSLATKAVSAILEASSGDLWIGTFGGGLDRFDQASGKAIHHRHRPGEPNSLCGDVVWSLAEDSRRTLWIATDGGLCSYHPARRTFSRSLLPVTGARSYSGRVASVAVNSDGAVWASTDLGIYRLHPLQDRWERLLLPSSLRTVFAETVFASRDGSIWLDAGGEGLRRFEPQSGRWREYPLRPSGGRRVASDGVWAIHEDRTGRLWLGSGAGLSRLDPASGRLEHWSSRDGLPGSVVYSILEDEAGRLWLGTNRGLVRFDERASGQRAFRAYDLLDGVGTLEFNRGAAHRTRSGEFIFGGVDGLVSFLPAAVQDDPNVPRPALTRIERGRRDGVDTVNVFALKRVVFGPRDEWFTFEFSALSYAQPVKNRYAHRLEGFDHDWIDIGTRRLARYTSVPPGRYVFRVKAANHDGVWNQNGVSLAVVVTPPFWRTPWFSALVTAVLVGLLYAAYRLRVARLLAFERLRLRIAGDLHDDLSTDLSSIALATDMLRRRPGVDAETSERLAEVRDRAMRMVDAVRDAVWSVNPQHDSWEALVHRMRTTAHDLLGDTPVRFDVAPPRNSEVGMSERRTLFLLFKEMLHNVARHAGAHRVEIELSGTEGGEIELTVKDDGVGFDPMTAQGGSGLEGMRYRAGQIGGELVIDSQPGVGTSVCFRTGSRKFVMARYRGGP